MLEQFLSWNLWLQIRVEAEELSRARRSGSVGVQGTLCSMSCPLKDSLENARPIFIDASLGKMTSSAKLILDVNTWAPSQPVGRLKKARERKQTTSNATTLRSAGFSPC